MKSLTNSGEAAQRGLRSLHCCPPWCALLQSCPVCKGDRGSVDTGKWYVPIRAYWKRRTTGAADPAFIQLHMLFLWIDHPLALGAHPLILCHTTGPQVACCKTAAWHTPRAHEAPWEMHLQTSHQTPNKFVCWEGLRMHQDRHIVS